MVNKVDGNNYYVYTKQKKIDIPDSGGKFNLSYEQNEASPKAKHEKEISGREKQQAAEKSGVRLELSSNGQRAGAERRNLAGTEAAKAKSTAGQAPLFETIRTYIMTAITAVRHFFYNIWNDQPQKEDSDIQLTEGGSQEADSDIQLTEGGFQEADSDIQLTEGGSQEADSDLQLLEGGFQEADSDLQLLEGDFQKADPDLQVLEGSAQEVVSDLRLVEDDNILRHAKSGRGALSGSLQGPGGTTDALDGKTVLALEEERQNRKIKELLRDGDVEHVIQILTDNGKKTIAKNSTLLTSYDKNGRLVEPNTPDMERALHGDRNTWNL